MMDFKRLVVRRTAALLGCTAAIFAQVSPAAAQSLREVDAGPNVTWLIADNDGGATQDDLEPFATAEEACRVGIQQTRDYKAQYGYLNLPEYSSTGPVEVGTEWNTEGYYARRCNISDFNNFALAFCPTGYAASPIAGGLDVRCVREDEPAECDSCKPGDTPLSQPPLPRIGGGSPSSGGSPMSVESSGPVSIDSGALKLSEQDYASPDGLLRVARLYNSGLVQKPLKMGDRTKLSDTSLVGFGEAWSGLIPGRVIASGKYSALNLSISALPEP